jgi:hypothetical protein
MTLPRNRIAAAKRLCALLGDRLTLAGLSVPQMPRGRFEFLLWVRRARRELREASHAR